MNKIQAVILGLLVVAAAVLTSLSMPQPAKPGKTVAQPRQISIIRLHNMQGQFFCSAAVISPRRAITAAHCVVDHMAEQLGLLMVIPELQVRDMNGQNMVIAHVLGASPRSDLAVIEGDFSKFAPAKHSTDPQTIIDSFAKHRIIMCGFPYGGGLWCTELQVPRMYQFQFKGIGRLFPGMSGGPVIDMDTGIIIGVNTAVDEDGAIVSPLINLLNAIGVEK